jgi:hypothetical protein
MFAVAVGGFPLSMEFFIFVFFVVERRTKFYFSRYVVPTMFSRAYTFSFSETIVDRLDSVAVNDPLPEELTLTELILRINDIRSLQPSSTALIHRYVRPTDGGDNSNSRQHHPPHSFDSCSSRPPQPDSRPQPLRDFCTRTDTQCVCGQWGHSVENCQQLAMHFLLVKHL